MFKLTCYVDDKKLGPALHALTGLVLNMEAPMPVANAVAKNGKVEQTGSQFIWERVASKLNEKSGRLISSAEIREIALAEGSSTIIGTLVGKLTEEGILKRKSRGLYSIA